MHDRPSDNVLAKIRALCAELAKRHRISDDAPVREPIACRAGNDH